MIGWGKDKVDGTQSGWVFGRLQAVLLLCRRRYHLNEQSFSYYAILCTRRQSPRCVDAEFRARGTQRGFSTRIGPHGRLFVAETASVLTPVSAVGWHTPRRMHRPFAR